ncbi:hypothetical protein [Methylobacterium sp. ID0610]|uniref:hypothetical protein n=1 Tax=Methylobacterium carpenticola TaxID=3344827 RepID=UPI00367E5976
MRPPSDHPGPRHPVGLILLIAVLLATAVGLARQSTGAFILVLAASLVALTALYAAVRRRLGWRPLDADALATLSGMPWM